MLLGWGRWRRIALAGGTFVAGFLLASPFVARPSGPVRKRCLALDHRAPLTAHSATSTTTGPGSPTSRTSGTGSARCSLVALLGTGLALAQRRQRADVLLPAFVGALFVRLLVTSAHPDRYTLALLPPLAALAGRVRYLASVALLLLVVPLTWTLRADVELTRKDTRAEALHWIAHHVPPNATLVEDPRLPRPRGPHVVRRPPGGVAVVGGGPVYLFVTGAVADPVLRARDRYPLEARFYDRLSRRTPLFRLEPSKRLTGPWVAVYRL